MILLDAILLVFLCLMDNAAASNRVIAAVGTWDFSQLALDSAIPLLLQGRSSVDAVVTGIQAVELDTKDQYFVGKGGLPNAEGDMELDAAIMDHNARYGAVMALKRIPSPISVAKTVMEQCVHNVLVGEGALKWALNHGFVADDSVLTEQSHREWKEWLNRRDDTESSHDTIGFICLDEEGCLAAGTSTSG